MLKQGAPFFFNKMNRKKFLFSAGLTALSASVFGSVKLDSLGGFKGDCETTNDILGPFYRENAPIRSDLTHSGMEGSIIKLKGRVFKEDCTSPIEQALVEIWHCNTLGEYDNESDAFHQRARLYSDKLGAYEFKTIMPGKYLNGALYRPSHIHYRVTAPGFKELISQIYFTGDPMIAKDPWASDKKAIHRILNVYPDGTNGALTIDFDIFMKSEG
mgnify:CR=1 FL=1